MPRLVAFNNISLDGQFCGPNGTGRSQFDGLTDPLDLQLVQSRSFANGKTYLCLRRPTDQPISTSTTDRSA